MTFNRFSTLLAVDHQASHRSCVFMLYSHRAMLQERARGSGPGSCATVYSTSAVDCFPSCAYVVNAQDLSVLWPASTS